MKRLADSSTQKINVRCLCKDAFEISVTFSVTIICNDKPDLSSTDGGIARRIRIVDFNVKFVDEPDPNDKCQAKLDTTFIEKMCTQEVRNAFIRLLIDRWINRGSKFDKIPVPEKIKISTADYIKDSNVIFGFMNEYYDITNNVNNEVQSSKLFNAFKSNNMDVRIQPRDFKKEVLHINGITFAEKRNANYYTGLKKKPEPEPEQDEGPAFVPDE